MHTCRLGRAVLILGLRSLLPKTVPKLKLGFGQFYCYFPSYAVKLMSFFLI